MSTQTEHHFVAWDHDLHYAMVADWWLGHKDEPVPKNLLPCYGVIIVDEDNEARGAAWYIIDTINQQAYISWLVSNPEAPLTRRLAAELMRRIAGMAQEQGATIIWAHVHDPRVTREAERIGFTVTAENATLIAGVL